jgi:hypothetical protein
MVDTDTELESLGESHRQGYEHALRVLNVIGERLAERDQVVKNRPTNALPRESLRHSHGLGLRVVRIEVLHCAASNELVTPPRSPQRHCRSAKLSAGRT